MSVSSTDVSDLVHVQHLYAHFFDGQWDLYDRIFVEDAVFDGSDQGFAILQGREEICEQVSAMHAGHTRQHMATNSAVLQDGVDGTAKMLSKFLAADEGGLLVFGTYEDDCVDTSQGWRIKRRVVRLTLAIKAERIDLDALLRGSI